MTMALKEASVLQHVDWPAAEGVDPDLPPLIVLHGLYGSTRNWRAVARRLTQLRRVVGLDLLNHGASPRSADCSYVAQARAVLATLDALGIERCVLVGHSMGGKTAMRLACDAPERVASLLVLDIAPQRNEPERALIDAMAALPLAQVSSRGEAERLLRPAVPDDVTRGFLLTNLVRSGEDPPAPPFRWQLGLAELSADFDSLGAAPLGDADRFAGPTHVLAGGASDYVSAGEERRYLPWFPGVTLDVLEGVGHNVHVEGGQAFVDWVAGRLD